MMATRLALPCVLLLAVCAGCESGSSTFQRVERGALGTGDDAAEAEAPGDEEVAVMLSAALFSNRGEDVGQWASAFQAVVDAAIPSAHADPVDGVHPSGCDSPPPSQSWISVSQNGPSGSYGAPGNRFVANTNTSYCQTPSGEVNAGSGLAKWYSVAGVVFECSWGNEYRFSMSGPVTRVGSTTEHRLFGGYSITNLSINRSTTAACTVDVSRPYDFEEYDDDEDDDDDDDDGDDDEDDGYWGLEDDLHIVGTCGSWSGPLTVSDNVNCWVED